MRVLWLMTRYWPAVGGAENHTRRIIHELSEAGHSNTVVAHWDSNRTDWLRGTTITAPSETVRYQDGPYVPVIRLGFPLARRLQTVLPAATYYLQMRLSAAALARMLEDTITQECGTDWDIIHAVRIGREPLYLAGYHLARRLGIPFVFTPLHHPRWVGRRYLTYIHLYRSADALIALTAYERSLYGALGVDPGRITVTGVGPILPPAADGARFRATHGISGQLILFLGQKYPYKGFEQLLAAAAHVWQRHPDTTFAFLGPRTSASRAVFSRVRDTRILELDAVDLQTKGDALAACDVFCLPSEQESFAGVFTEAWSYGKPVIGCGIPAVQEVITDGEDGIIVPVGKSADLAAAILALLDDPLLRARLGAAGQHKVASRYTWSRIAHTITDTYDSVRSRTRPATPGSHSPA